MSKLKNGTSVRIKKTGEYGVIVAREQSTINTKEKGTVVKYVIKVGDGVNGYKAYLRSEFMSNKKANMPTTVSSYPRIYNYEHKCSDGRTIVLTGVVNLQSNKVFEKTTYEDIDIFESFNNKKKTLSVGYAICHPHDSNEPNIGADIAYRRALSKPLSYLESPYRGEFREDFVKVVLQSKAKFVEDNIDRFINRDKKK